MANQVQNEPTAAYILSLLGGIIGLIISIVFLAIGALGYAAYNTIIGEYGYYYDFSGIGWGFGAWLGLGAWCLISSILTIVFASKLKSNPLEHTKWGALILVFSIIGLGTLLAFIGGILALTYKPILYGAPQQQYYGPPPSQPVYQQPMVITCPQCGTQVQNNVRFCPNCGRQLN